MLKDIKVSFISPPKPQGEIIYENDTLKLIQLEEGGRIVPNATTGSNIMVTIYHQADFF
ncbi:MAG: hypothetical protein AAF620_09895 [Bacteroidota bacterium]